MMTYYDLLWCFQKKWRFLFPSTNSVIYLKLQVVPDYWICENSSYKTDFLVLKNESIYYQAYARSRTGFP